MEEDIQNYSVFDNCHVSWDTLQGCSTTSKTPLLSGYHFIINNTLKARWMRLLKTNR